MTLSSKAGVFSIDFAPKSPLESAVYSLNAKAKQAIFGASRRQVIARGTWSGCAFNAGSLEVLPDGMSGVRDIDSAAEVFGVTPFTVVKFISAWDGSAQHSFLEVRGKKSRLWDPNPDYMEEDMEATERLSELILRAGLFSDNPTFRFRVYDEQELSAIEEFKQELADGKFLEGLFEAEMLLTPA